MTPDQTRRVRALDVAWAHADNERRTGHPYRAARSEFSGRDMTADEVALMSLHNLRCHVGSKAEAKESRAWLAQYGVAPGIPVRPLSAFN